MRLTRKNGVSPAQIGSKSKQQLTRQQQKRTKKNLHIFILGFYKMMLNWNSREYADENAHRTSRP
jgi:hypothetical protein